MKKRFKISEQGVALSIIIDFQVLTREVLKVTHTLQAISPLLAIRILSNGLWLNDRRREVETKGLLECITWLSS